MSLGVVESLAETKFDKFLRGAKDWAVRSLLFLIPGLICFLPGVFVCEAMTRLGLEHQMEILASPQPGTPDGFTYIPDPDYEDTATPSASKRRARDFIVLGIGIILWGHAAYWMGKGRVLEKGIKE